jgi:hypothetical protein
MPPAAIRRQGEGAAGVPGSRVTMSDQGSETGIRSACWNQLRRSDIACPEAPAASCGRGGGGRRRRRASNPGGWRSDGSGSPPSSAERARLSAFRSGFPACATSQRSTVLAHTIHRADRGVETLDGVPSAPPSLAGTPFATPTSRHRESRRHLDARLGQGFRDAVVGDVTTAGVQEDGAPHARSLVLVCPPEVGRCQGGHLDRLHPFRIGAPKSLDITPRLSGFHDHAQSAAAAEPELGAGAGPAWWAAVAVSSRTPSASGRGPWAVPAHSALDPQCGSARRHEGSGGADSPCAEPSGARRSPWNPSGTSDPGVKSGPLTPAPTGSDLRVRNSPRTPPPGPTRLGRSPAPLYGWT